MKKPRHLRLVKNRTPVLPEVVELDDLTDVDVRAAFIARFGPECAAWLCNRFRVHVRERGYYSLHLTTAQELPPWLEIAVSYLERHRAHRWKVDRYVVRGTRFIHVEWIGTKKPLPASLVPVGRA